ncbi:MAG: protein TolR [Alphaproteobacteria bacterium]|nr:protein TolR [Alphaproteobacteria bacterium]
MAGVINGNGRRHGRVRMRPNADINITPMVDVMLVLLIIFMVTAPLLTAGVAVDLPKTRAKLLSQEKDPLTVTIEKNGKVFLGGAKKESEAIPIEEIAAKVKAIAENGYDQRILVRGDKAVDYGTVVQVMGELNAAGFRRIGLVTDPPRGESKKSQ